MVESRLFHWVTAKHVLRYLCGTVGYDLKDVSSDEVKLQRYTNFD